MATSAKNEFFSQMLTDFSKLSDILKTDYFEILLSLQAGEVTSYKKIAVKENFPAVPFEKLKEQKDFTAGGEPVKLDIAAETGTIFCKIFPVASGNKNIAYLVLQSKIPLDPKIEPLVHFFTKTMSRTAIAMPDDAENKYKEELAKFRTMQARLFPKFENIQGMDISSVYLPAELMSGNFIDAFNIDENIYQITTCSILGNDSSASFLGATLRTIIRSFASNKYVPSALIDLAINKLSKMTPKLPAMLYITIFQINLSTGKIQISSYGEPNTILYRSAKKTGANLNKTQIGMDLAKRIVQKDLAFTLDPNDALLYYSMGVEHAMSEDGKNEFGENRLMDAFRQNVDQPSLSISHAIVESIYEFTNYSHQQDDVIIICIKKKTASA